MTPPNSITCALNHYDTGEKHRWILKYVLKENDARGTVEDGLEFKERGGQKLVSKE